MSSKSNTQAMETEKIPTSFGRSLQFLLLWHRSLTFCTTL